MTTIEEIVVFEVLPIFVKQLLILARKYIQSATNIVHCNIVEIIERNFYGFERSIGNEDACIVPV
jgi:hypothetical protein